MQKTYDQKYVQNIRRRDDFKISVRNYFREKKKKVRESDFFFLYENAAGICVKWKRSEGDRSILSTMHPRLSKGMDPPPPPL